MIQCSQCTECHALICSTNVKKSPYLKPCFASCAQDLYNMGEYPHQVEKVVADLKALQLEDNVRRKKQGGGGGGLPM